jgi:hypothetical protein
MVKVSQVAAGGEERPLRLVLPRKVALTVRHARPSFTRSASLARDRCCSCAQVVDTAEPEKPTSDESLSLEERSARAQPRAAARVTAGAQAQGGQDVVRRHAARAVVH